MVNMAKFVTLAAAATFAVTAGIAVTSSDADAHRRAGHHRHAAASTCKPAMSGSATGQGLFGKGTAQAQAAARYDWEVQSHQRLWRCLWQLRQVPRQELRLQEGRDPQGQVLSGRTPLQVSRRGVEKIPGRESSLPPCFL